MARLAVEIIGDSSSLERSLKRSAKAAGRFNSEIGKAGKGDLFGGMAKGAAGMAAGFVGITGIAGLFQKIITDASDLNEEIGKSKVVFKESSAEILAWSKTTAQGFGISRENALEASGQFGSMLIPMGVARDKAADMSQAFVELAGDLASFHGGSTADALAAIRSGLAGETEPLRQYGIGITEARIKTEAAALGFMKGADAAKAAKEAYKDSGETFRSASKAQSQATKELTAAQSGLKSSQRAVETSLAGVESAQEGVVSSTQAATDAQDRQKDAAERLTSAKLQLRDAQNASKTAQVALTDARKQAVAQLKELKDTAIDASLSESRAQLSLDQARKRLQDTMKDSTATELDRRDALLSVQEAERGVQDAAQNRKDIAKKIRDADKKGIEGSQEVIDARKGIADAHDNEEQAARGVAGANRAFADAQGDVSEALRKVANAQSALSTAQTKAQAAIAKQQQAQSRLAAAQDASRRANERAKTAEDALKAAKEKSDRLNKGRVDGLTAEQKLMAINAILFKDSKDAQGDAARTGDQLAGSMRSSKASMEDLSASLGQILTPALTDFLAKFSTWIGDAENQKAVIDTFKTAFELFKIAVDAIKGAFDALSTATGGSKNAIGLLVAAFAAWKVAGIVGKIGQISTAFGGVSGKAGKAKGAAGKFNTSLIGKGGLVVAAGAAAYALTSMFLGATGLDKKLEKIGAAAYDLAGDLGLVNDQMAKFEGKTTPGQQQSGVIRQTAAVLQSRGMTPAQSAAAIRRIHPTADPRSIEVLSGVYGTRPQLTINGGLHVTGVQNVRALEDEIARRMKQRPRPRRGN